MGNGNEERDRAGRRRKRFLSAQQKYEIWLKLVTREVTQNEAAERWGVDRSTIIRIRQMAKDGALEALAARPGMRWRKEDSELAVAKAEIARLAETVKEQAVELTLLRGKGGSGW